MKELNMLRAAEALGRNRPEAGECPGSTAGHFTTPARTPVVPPSTSAFRPIDRERTRSKHGLPLVAALLCAAVFANTASALSFAEVPPIETIAAQASLAFRGVVVGIDHADAQLDTTHRYPYTLTHLRALACYRGCTAGQIITVARVGGPRGGDMHHYLIIPGVASFSPGEEVVILSNDVTHPFFGSSFGDYGVLRVARQDGRERVVLSYHGELLRDRGGALRPDGASRCEPLADQPANCVSTSDATDESADEDDSGQLRQVRTGAAVTPEALDARMRDIASRHPLAQAAQSVSGDGRNFEQALVRAFKRSGALR